MSLLNTLLDKGIDYFLRKEKAKQITAKEERYLKAFELFEVFFHEWYSNKLEI